MSSGPTMVKLAKDYLTYRRKLGVELKSAGPLLIQFARYADRSGHRGSLTSQLAIRWAGLPPKTSRAYLARRLDVVRCFAKHRAIFDPDTEIPAYNVFGPAYRRVTPHIYTAAEISALLVAARDLPPRGGLRPHTYATLFGLLACTGLRLQEALRLTRSDVDWKRGILTIRETKFCKSRLVPLHPTAIQALRDYGRLRDRHHPTAKTAAFFLTVRGTRVCRATAESAFLQLRRKLSWSPRGGRPAPRIHDLRHTFACNRLLLWHKQHVDVEHQLLALSTYLGHANVKDTYWYLTAVPELLQLAGARFEHFTELNSGDHK
jgi:integrase